MRMYLLILIFFISISSNAQTGIGTTTPHASAKLEVSSDRLGFLPPRVTLTSTTDNTTIRNAAGSAITPADGLLVFNTATAGTSPNNVVPGYYYWNGSSWLRLIVPTSPTLVTPTLGVASATSVNKVTITAPTTSATLTIADSKTLSVNNSLTFSGTDGTAMTFPSTTATIARTDAAQTFTGTQTFGDIIANSVSGSSDLRFKNNIRPISNALDKVKALSGVYFNWNQIDYPERQFGSNTELGFIAQEVEKIVPEIVIRDKTNEEYRSVKYDKLVALLFEAIKEQQKQIDSLNHKVNNLIKNYNK